MKTGSINQFTPVDCCLAGIELGATLVARTFSGDKRQISGILKAALQHNGLAVVDVISPCVAFNDHEGSTKSYSYMKDHEEPLHEVNFIPYFDEIEVEVDEGSTKEVTLHDGSRLCCTNSNAITIRLTVSMPSRRCTAPPRRGKC